ncbi:MAG: cation transporter [Bacteroidales bacterium]|nr:cation transporter [Bacteroidales bacterium]
MKTLITIILIAIPALIYAQSENGHAYQAEKKTAQTDTLTFTVYGMDCPGCEGGLEKQVNKIPAIEYSQASWVNQELKIVVKPDSSLDTDELERRVKKANFTLHKGSKKRKNEE